MSGTHQSSNDEDFSPYIFKCYYYSSSGFRNINLSPGFFHLPDYSKVLDRIENQKEFDAILTTIVIKHLLKKRSCRDYEHELTFSAQDDTWRTCWGGDLGTDRLTSRHANLQRSEQSSPPICCCCQQSSHRRRSPHPDSH